MSREHNGPDVDCYGLNGTAKRNYTAGGYCYESSMPNKKIGKGNVVDESVFEPEQLWHAIQHTMGLDFSDNTLGGTIVSLDNSGNVYKGAFDPHCTGTDEKWKVHDTATAFGTNQHEDPIEDKYWHGEQTHGTLTVPSAIDIGQNDERTLLNSIKDKPMTWNLWNIVRHYAYIQYFKNKNRVLGTNKSAWNELEKITEKLVKNIYRTFKENQKSGTIRNTFSHVDDAITNNGDRCLIKWTNSFIQIASIFDRNAREHDASFVLFTGNDNDFSGSQAQKYNWIKNHHDNFIVTTFNGPDDDQTGMRPRSINGDLPIDDVWKSTSHIWTNPKDSEVIFNGFGFNELPTNYIVGDIVSYPQSYSEVIKIHSPLLNMDTEYPESEYYKDDTSRKWIRKVQSTYLNTQILPVYTNMESMTTNFHKLTVAEMKSITFQVIPQFYWQYKWSFNEFMIHRVGKLNSHGDVPLYDMLGNVWELVRDDYVDDIRTRIVSNSINPIVGDKTNTHSKKKVIRGGSFDQFCRKVISSSREGVNQDSCRSEFATQANIGFRPSMTFTVEDEGSTFKVGDPVDLFFLFDASASQDNQVLDMLKSANEIVEMFAPTKSGDDIPTSCNVGSALFLGQNIRFMCCQKQAETSGTNSDYINKENEYLIRAYIRSSTPTDSKKEYENGCEKYLEDVAAYKEKWGNNNNRYTNQVQESLNKFWSRIKKQYQSSDGDIIGESRNNIQDDIVEYDNFEEEDNDIELLTRDGSSAAPGGHGGDDGGDGKVWYPKYWYPIILSYAIGKKLNIYSGVSAYKDESNNIVYYATKEHRNKVLFTQNPYDNATYEYPYILDDKGCLSTWLAGSEPVSWIISKLLDGSYFYQDISNVSYNAPGVGYLFRKSDIPKLIFVFSNEYDNSMWRSERINEILATPSWENGGIVLRCTNHKDTRIPTGDYVSQNPLDPFCIQMLNGTNFGDYLSDIGLGGYIDYFNVFINGLNMALPEIPVKYFPSAKSIKFGYKNRPTFLSKISLADNCALGQTNFGIDSWAKIKQILTDEQIKSINDYIRNPLTEDTTTYGFPGVVFDGKISRTKQYNVFTQKENLVRYDQYKTIGFYNLMKTTRTLDKNMNIYLMVSDANAPTNDELALYKDMLLFQDLRDITLPTDINSKLYSLYYGLPFNIKGRINGQSKDFKSFTWESLFLLNIGYWSQLNNASGATDTKVFNGLIGDGQSKDLSDVFGLENPYTTIKTVIGIRDASYKTKLTDISSNERIILGIPLNNNAASKRNIVKYIKDELSKLDDVGREDWFNKHLCLVTDWYNEARVKNDMFCYKNMDESNANIHLIQFKSAITSFDDAKEKIITDSNINGVINYHIKEFIPFESPRYGNNIYNNSCGPKITDDYIAKNKGLKYYIGKANPGTVDYVTIKYKDSENNPTGLLKIVCFGKNPSLLTSRKLSVSSKTNNIINALIPPSTCNTSMPDVWRCAIYKLSNLVLNDDSIKSYKALYQNLGTKAFGDDDIKDFVRNFYDNLKGAMPALMASRYYYQICKHLKNGIDDGKSMIDYSDNTNTVIMKPLPIMDVKDMKNIFNVSFNGGQFNSGTAFSQQYCVIDINPASSDYQNLPSGKFPMQFVSDISDININEYKTSKIVLSRIKQISGFIKNDAIKTFSMGSSTNDYNEITDRLKLLYRDSESIVSASPNKNVTVTLKNGGSYQKNDSFYGIDNDNNGKIEVGTTDTVPLTQPNYTISRGELVQDTKKRQIPKYFRNKHLFVDPFALTISQWCYANGKNTRDSAITFLGSDFDEIKRSYFRYLWKWETDEFKTLLNNQGIILDLSTATDSEVEAEISNLVALDIYNPLEDTRPYYYATYDKVRGTSQIYQNSSGATSATYLINSANGDEFQMNSRTGTESFLDILNNKVVNYTAKRFYRTENGSSYTRGSTWWQFGDTGGGLSPTIGTDGGRLNDMYEATSYKMYTQNLEKDGLSLPPGIDNDGKGWFSGEAGGLNFDLPTEAQWEYCCRQDTITAIPPNYNLGDNYEENDEYLSRIAWYKYKVIGSLPEPERFCAWRIAKMIFGISKDSEQVNNVYETTTW